MGPTKGYFFIHFLNNRILMEENKLSIERPELAAQIHPYCDVDPERYAVNSTDVSKWLCSNETPLPHEFYSPIRCRSVADGIGMGCKVCSCMSSLEAEILENLF